MGGQPSAQGLLGTHKRQRLDVEGGDGAARADGFGEKGGVVSVAHREIDGGVAGAEMGENEMLLQGKQIDHGAG